MFKAVPLVKLLASPLNVALLLEYKESEPPLKVTFTDSKPVKTVELYKYPPLAKVQYLLEVDFALL